MKTAIEADPRWAAVLARNAAADGRFVYAVTTTGVYCHPSCGARTPRPEHVRFHPTPADAERAGFRPCQRCLADQPPPAVRNSALVTGLCRFIEQADHVPSLQELADHAGLSVYHLHRVFKSVTGLTPRAYAAAHRSQRVRSALERGAAVTDAIYTAGYASSGRFYAGSNQVLGMTPSRYRNGGSADAVIRFALDQCSLGAILVATSERGICAISLGEDADALVRDLENRFPRADLRDGDVAFKQLVTRVVDFVESLGNGLDLPLDVRGTAFQQCVWLALSEIPPSEIVTHSRRPIDSRGGRSIRVR